MSQIANTPKPPYYAVIFTSKLNTVHSDNHSAKHENSPEAYHSTADRMLELATSQPGFLGFESAREALGITVSYWESLDAIQAWKAQPEHLIAQQNGQQIWYSEYYIRIAKVERNYGFDSLK